MWSSPLTELTQIAISLDALNCGALLISRSGVIAHVNPRLCVMAQRGREDLAGRTLASLYPPGEDPGVASILERFDEPIDQDFFLPLPGGDRLPVILSARPVGSESVLAEYAVVTLIDISRQKDAEKQLMEQNSYIGELSDRVIHQAKNLRGYADELEYRVRQRTAELHEAHMETMYMLAIASEAKDVDTGKHVRRLRQLSFKLAVAMGLDTAHADRIGFAAVLHDVGKIHTPDRVLKKPGALDETERTHMQAHTLAGERILKPSPYFAEASRVARSHHENWDGTGYPDQLVGKAIPLEARIVHLADVFDALTHPRVYKSAWTVAEAVVEIRHNRGVMFDPQVVDAFEQLLADGELNDPAAGEDFAGSACYLND